MLQKRVGLYQDREATQTGKMSGCIKIQRRDTNKVGEIEVTVLQSYTHTRWGWVLRIKFRDTQAERANKQKGKDSIQWRLRQKELHHKISLLMIPRLMMMLLITSLRVPLDRTRME